MSENRWSLVVAVGLAVFMAQVDASIVNVALPTIQRDFGVHPDFSQWVILGYLLPVVALVVPAGRWLDTVGKRAALTFSVAGFAVASAAAGAAPGISWLIAARAVQGGFGALLVAQLPVLATTAVRPEARGRAMGIVATLGPLGAVSGPALGGALLAVAGWPAIFFVNVPVALAVIAVGLRSLPSDGPLRVPDRGLAAEFALLGGAGTAALLALSLAPARPAWLLLALLAVPLVAAWRRLPGAGPVAGLVRTPRMARQLAAVLLAGTGVQVVVFLAPFYLQQVLHAAITTTGLALMTASLTIAATSLLAGVIADRWGARPTAAAGLVVLTASLVLMLPLDTAWRPVDLVWRLALAGLGMGLFVAPNQALTMGQAPRALLATTGATMALTRSLGFALGPALATAIWAAGEYSVGGMRAAVAAAAVPTALAAVATAVPSRRGGEAVVATADARPVEAELAAPAGTGSS